MLASIILIFVYFVILIVIAIAILEKIWSTYIDNPKRRRSIDKD